MEHPVTKTIKVLSIGNSFSRNAQTYLYDIAKASGTEMVVANLYIGGCSLDRHWNNAYNDEKAYLYSKTGQESKTASIKDALIEEEWDYVTFQQKSDYSGLPETYFPYLTNLQCYVREFAPIAQHVIHQTWAYESGSEVEGFRPYDNDQLIMYNALKRAYYTAKKKAGIKLLLPVGEAFQIARAGVIGDHLCTEDKAHAELNGCYLAGCVWYEVLTGNEVRNNTFMPEEVPAEQIPILKECAHMAIKRLNI